MRRVSHDAQDLGGQLVDDGEPLEHHEHAAIRIALVEDRILTRKVQDAGKRCYAIQRFGFELGEQRQAPQLLARMT